MVRPRLGHACGDRTHAPISETSFTLISADELTFFKS